MSEKLESDLKLKLLMAGELAELRELLQTMGQALREDDSNNLYKATANTVQVANALHSLSLSFWQNNSYERLKVSKDS